MLLKTFTAAAVAASALVLAAPAATTAEPAMVPKPMVVTVQSRDGHDRRVTIHNQTGWTMTHFYASDSRSDSWEEDILGSGVLAAGASQRINIDDGSGACVYDFKARFSNGQELTKMGINVCQIADYYYTR